MANNPSITKEELNQYSSKMLAISRRWTVDEVCKVHISHALVQNELRLDFTARELDIDRKTLYRKVLQIREAVELG